MTLDPAAYRGAMPPSGDPSPDSVGVALALADRNRSIRNGFVQQGGWSFPNTGAPNTDGLSFGDLSWYDDSTVEIARYNPPLPPGNRSHKVTVWIYLADVSDGNVEYSFFGDGGSEVLWTPSAGDDGWHEVPGIVSTGELIVLATITGSTSQQVRSVCCFASQSAPGAYQTVAQFDFQEGRPHDVASIRSINRLQDFVQTSYPIARGSHFLGDPVSKGTQPNDEKIRYRFWVGPRVSLTVSVLTKMTGSNTYLAVSLGPVGGTPDLPFGGGTPSTQPRILNDGTGATWHDYHFSAGVQTSNTLHEVEVTFESGSGNLTVLAVEILQRGFAVDDSIALVNDISGIDQIPEQAILSRGRSALVAGAPVIGSFWEADRGRQANWSDVRSMVHNALFNVLWRTQTLVCDRLPGLTPNNVGISDGPITLAWWGHRPTRGMARLRVHLRTYRITSDANSAQVRARFVVNDVEGATHLINDDGYTALTLDLAESAEIRLDFLYTDPRGNPDPLVGDFNDKLYLSALYFEEIPQDRDPGAQYFRTVTEAVSSPDNDIPDNDSALATGRSKDIVVAPDFAVRRIRVWAAITHLLPSQLTLRLTCVSTGAFVDFVTNVADGSGALVCYSEYRVFDTIHTDDDLSVLVGGSSRGTWRLTVFDRSVGTTGTFDAFGIELT